MEWIELNKNRLPEKEVLAANFLPGTHGYKEKLLGYLHLAKNQDSKKYIVCESEYEVLLNCTHYIDINSFDLN